MGKTLSHIISGAAAVSVAVSALAQPMTAWAQPLADGKAAVQYLVENRQEEIIKRKPVKESAEEFPEVFDLREQGYVTPVKFQNPWGTCWGFSTTMALNKAAADAESLEEDALTKLGYAEPAGSYHMETVAKAGMAAAVVLLLIVLEMIHLVKNHKRKKLIKALKAELEDHL